MGSALGWCFLGLVTFGIGVTAYWVSAAQLPRTGAATRSVATLLWAPTLMLWTIQLCGVLERLTILPVLGVAVVLCSGACLWASRRVSWSGLLALARNDLTLPRRVLGDAVATREPAILLVAVALGAFALSAALSWYFRSWGWDAVWYHVPITRFALQRHSTRWVDSHIPWISSYPRNAEWLQAWSGLFTGDSRLDDAAQLPLGLLGVAVIAAWARREGTRPSLALAVGMGFLVLPPVFLQLHTSYVDVAGAAFFAAAIFFTSGSEAESSVPLAALAMGLYLGTKFSGAFHLLLWLPWVCLRALRGKRRWQTLLTSAALLLSVGAYTYVQNFLQTGNPFFPFRVDVPWLGLHLPGTWLQSRLFEVPEGRRLYFFGAPDEPLRTWRSWFETPKDFWPDPRTGGFGPLFRWLLLPAVVVLPVQVVLRRLSFRRVAPVLVLFAFALSVPGTWWPRYVMGAAIASLVAFALAVTPLHPRWVARLASLVLVGLGSWGFVETLQHIEGPFPSEWSRAVHSDAAARDTLQLTNWMWPTFWSRQRERELGPDSTIAYDQGTSFVGEFFRPDYRGRVLYLPSTGDPADYVKRVQASHARWVGVSAGSPAERALIRAGAEWLFHAPRSEVDLCRMPPTRLR